MADAPGLDVDAAVVIDVLRAFTVAPWLIGRGAARVLLADSEARAVAAAAAAPGAVALKDGRPAPGFGLANSPGQIARADLAGRTVVQKTTNGTVGVFGAWHVPLILCGALVTASATVRALRTSGARRVGYVISGEDGTAEEDLACADLVHALLTGGHVVRHADYERRVRDSGAARRLLAAQAAGHLGIDADDVALSARADVFDFALRVSGSPGDGLAELAVVR